MALFDLGKDVRLTRDVPASLARTWQLAREVVQGYESMGFQVAFVEELAPSKLIARITDPQGTKLETRVTLSAVDRTSRLEIELTGKIEVGGMAGMFATDAKVRSVAKERLSGLLDKRFSNLPPEPEPAAPAPAAPANPSGAPVEERLAVLKGMLDRGLISEADYKKKKQEILASL